jgi:hypothetical protein
LLAYVSSGRQFKQLTEADMTPEMAVDDAVEVLRLALRDKPDLRASVMARLGSEAEVVSDG